VRLVWGTVSAIESEATGVQTLSVELDAGQPGRAVNYPSLAGPCVAGDRVLLNTTAVDLSLGTGGTHFVVARLGEGSGVALDDPSGGHIMKLRYTPHQRDVLSVESPESPHHAVMASADDLGGVPVACCGLHSHVPLVAAAIKSADPLLRVVYCMTDQAALPLPLSNVVRECRSQGLLEATISCGQAFGGDLEAVNLHSGLIAARHVAAADVIIVAIGPGVVGTATPVGHGGIAQGEALNAVASLGGAPVACLRVSFADARERHRVVSHHTVAALTRIALAPVTVAVPHLEPQQATELDTALEAAGVWKRHARAEGSSHPAQPDLRGITVTTMRRGFSDDSAFFFAAYAAGDVAASMAREKVTDKT
jgi:hypothetical protein